MTVIDVHLHPIRLRFLTFSVIEFAIARILRERGWIVPAYTMVINLTGSNSR
jgi:hypothetical protein